MSTLTQEQQDQLANIKVGMGGTYHTALGGFKKAFTVVDVRRNGLELDIQYDIATPTENYNYYGNQEHTFEPDPRGGIETWTRRKNGQYIQKGQPMERWSSVITLGYRRDFIDPHN